MKSKAYLNHTKTRKLLILMFTCNSIHITLIIKDEKIQFTENFLKEVKVGDTLNLIYYAKLTPTTPSYCEKCGTKNNNYQIIKHGFKECTIRMPMVSNTPTLLKLTLLDSK